MTHASEAGARSADEDDKISRLTYKAVIWIAAILFVFLVILQTLHGRPASLQLHFNIFAVLSIVSLISNVVAFVLVLRIKRRSEVLVWFAAFLLSVASWAAGEAMTRFSATPEAAVFWAPIGTPGSVFMPLTLFMFTLAYTRPKYYLQPFILPALIAIAVLFVFLDNHSNLIAMYDVTKMTQTPWGYLAASGEAFGLLSLWAAVPPAACIILLYRFRKQTIDPTLRRQAQLFMIAIAIPLIGGSITDGILPTLNFTVLPPLSVILLTVMGAIISYGVFKYRLFSITPSLIADEILGTINEAVLGVQPNFRINFVNTGAEQLFGMTAKQLSNKRISEFWQHHSHQSTLEEKIIETLGTRNSGTIESLEFKTPTGASFTAKVSITRLNDETQPYGYLIVITDITALARSAAIIERKVAERTHELHEEQAKLRASIDSLPLGFALVDESDALVIQNHALKHIFGSKKSPIDLQEMSKSLSGVALAEECATVRHSRRPVEFKEVGMGAKVLRLFIAPVRIHEAHERDTVIGTVILVQDITEEKVLARSRDEFFSIASHELRTPLTSIKGNASMMIDYYKDLLDKDDSFREMVFDIHTSSSRLVEIVSDFLDVSRIEQGKMVFRPTAVELDKILESVFYEMRAIIREKSIKLESNVKTLGALPKVWADKDRLTQILYNLVGNAVKFTNKGGVAVHITHDHEHAFIRVIDTGRGISLENRKLLFHKFQQAGDSLLTRDTTRGTGLGLYISKLMAESMHGSIKLEKTEPNVGSTFLLTVPIATKAQITASRTQKPTEKIDVATGLSKH